MTDKREVSLRTLLGLCDLAACLKEHPEMNLHLLL